MPSPGYLRVGPSAHFQRFLGQILSLYFKPKMPLFGHKDRALTFFVVIRPVSNLAGLQSRSCLFICNVREYHDLMSDDVIDHEVMSHFWTFLRIVTGLLKIWDELKGFCFYKIIPWCIVLRTMGFRSLQSSLTKFQRGFKVEIFVKNDFFEEIIAQNFPVSDSDDPSYPWF